MKLTMRNFHIWTGVFLGLPLLAVGCTTFFIAHEKSLGLKEISVPAGPGRGELPEIRSSFRRGDESWIGAGGTVYRVTGGRASPLEGAPRDEIRDMAAAGDAVLLAGKKGLWRYEQGESRRVYSGDCWQIAASGEGYRAACKGAGLLDSGDGAIWKAAPIDFPAEAMIAGGAPLSKIIIDIHTGKLFLGDDAKWLWIDLLGAATIGWSTTGLIMWLRSRRARAARLRRSSVALGSPAE
jgi:hypothetical protein